MTVQTIIGEIGRISAQAGLLIVLVLMVQRMFGRKLSAHWRSTLWWVVIVRLAIPVLPPTPFSMFNAIPFLRTTRATPAPSTLATKTVSQPTPTDSMVNTAIARAEKNTVSAVGSIRTDNAPPPSSPAVVQTPSLVTAAAAPGRSPTFGEWVGQHWQTCLAGIWLAGVIGLLTYLALATLRFRKQLARSPVVDNWQLVEQLEHCKIMMGVKTELPMLQADAITTPALCGLIRPRLLLPKGFAANFTTAEQRFIFLHELAHIRRRDIWLNWLVTWLQIIYWFNPLIWLAFARFRADREMACDALVLQKTGDQQNEAYGRTLISMLQNISASGLSSPGLAGLLEDMRQLQRRIHAIAEFTPTVRGGTLALVLMVGLSAIALTDARESDNNALPPVIPLSLKSVFVEAETSDWFRGAGSGWQIFPKGLQSMGGITFQLDGLVQIYGQQTERTGRNFREKVVIPLVRAHPRDDRQPEAPLGANVGSLHLLGTVAFTAPQGTKLADLVWRYTDGTYRTTPIEYAVHLRDWWRTRYEEPAELPYPYTKVAWRGIHPDPVNSERTLRLYRVTLANPQPKKTIKELEFVSARNRPTLLFAGLTLDPLKPGERPDDSPDFVEVDPPLPDRLRLTVQNAAGQPISGAQVSTDFRQTAARGAVTAWTKTVITDAAGVADLQHDARRVTRLELNIAKEDYAARKVVWSVPPGQGLPSAHTVQLKAGVRIGGVVVDAGGNPIMGATVALAAAAQFAGAGLAPSIESPDLSAQLPVTDVRGYWEARGIPQELIDSITLTVTHPDYILNRAQTGETGEIKKQLLAGSHILTLQRGMVATVRVVDENGKPVPNANVWIGRKWYTSERRQGMTDRQGRYTFLNVKAGNLPVSVVAKGFRPVSIPVTLQPEMGEIELKLTPGGIIQGRVVDGFGGPLPFVRVALSENRGPLTYDFVTETDKDGRFEWKGAPEEPTPLMFSLKGFQTMLISMRAGATNQIVLHATGQP